ncbi:MAG: hypothetical protein GY762_19910 [Proteobacteria bacterium]|nr:hypothetical protein [Pseudomonadota bacterium]
MSAAFIALPPLPCPIPKTLARPATLLSCPDAVLRHWAVQQCRKSIDLAVETGAKAVCIHAGQVPIPDLLEWTL